MTKFTPPTTFPHECLSARSGFEVTLWAPADKSGEYPATVTGADPKYNTTFSREYLIDKPVVTKRWFNVYESGTGCFAYISRDEADEANKTALGHRLYVIREETCNGEIAIYKEDV